MLGREADDHNVIIVKIKTKFTQQGFALVG